MYDFANNVFVYLPMTLYSALMQVVPLGWKNAVRPSAWYHVPANWKQRHNFNTNTVIFSQAHLDIRNLVLS